MNIPDLLSYKELFDVTLIYKATSTMKKKKVEPINSLGAGLFTCRLVLCHAVYVSKLGYLFT